jgi:hypothetical protein
MQYRIFGRAPRLTQAGCAAPDRLAEPAALLPVYGGQELES